MFFLLSFLFFFFFVENDNFASHKRDQLHCKSICMTCVRVRVSSNRRRPQIESLSESQSLSADAFLLPSKFEHQIEQWDSESDREDKRFYVLVGRPMRHSKYEMRARARAWYDTAHKMELETSNLRKSLINANDVNGELSGYYKMKSRLPILSIIIIIHNDTNVSGGSVRLLHLSSLWAHKLTTPQVASHTIHHIISYTAHTNSDIKFRCLPMTELLCCFPKANSNNDA